VGPARSGHVHARDERPPARELGAAPGQFRDYRDWPNITRGPVSRGCSDADIRAILGENFLRVFEQVCG